MEMVLAVMKAFEAFNKFVTVCSSIGQKPAEIPCPKTYVVRRAVTKRSNATN